MEASSTTSTGDNAPDPESRPKKFNRRAIYQLGIWRRPSRCRHDARRDREPYRRSRRNIADLSGRLPQGLSSLLSRRKRPRSRRRPRSAPCRRGRSYPGSSLALRRSRPRGQGSGTTKDRRLRREGARARRSTSCSRAPTRRRRPTRSPPRARRHPHSVELTGSIASAITARTGAPTAYCAAVSPTTSRLSVRPVSHFTMSVPTAKPIAPARARLRPRTRSQRRRFRRAGARP